MVGLVLKEPSCYWQMKGGIHAMSGKDKKLSSLVNDLSDRVQAQDTLLKDLQKQMAQQQEALNNLLNQVEAQERTSMRVQEYCESLNQTLYSLAQNESITLPLPPPPRPRDAFPVSDIFSKLDLEKVLKIAMYVSNVYSEKDDDES
jgi:septal ring factor EnvC (AmiA/AmiB activator)